MAAALFLVFGIALVAICGWTIIRGPGWFWALKQWVRIAMMLSLGLVGGLGAWRAAVDAEAVEPVWLGAGTTGAVPWPVLPVRVRMAADLDTYLPAVQQAMRMWNESAGCRLFVEEPPESVTYDVRILFLQGAPCDAGPAGPIVDKAVAASTYFCGSGGVDISVERLDEMQAAYVVFAHELGHAIGLAHDPIGLMAPKAEAMTLVFPSEKDTRAIRARYCGGKP